MPVLTSRVIEAHKPRDVPYKINIDRGVQLRIAPNGVRTVLIRYIVKGTKEELQHTLSKEYGDGPGRIKLADACAEGQRIRALARAGIDWPAQEEARLQAEAEARQEAIVRGMTLRKGVEEYIERKRRAKDGLSLKARTKAEYLDMVTPGKVGKNGRKFDDGELVPLADTPMPEITAQAVWATYNAALKHSKRRADLPAVMTG